MHPRATAIAAALALCVLPWLSACGTASPATGGTRPASPVTSSTTAPAPADAGSESQAAPTGVQLTAALPPLPQGARPWGPSAGPYGLLDPAGYVTAAFGRAEVAADLPIELHRGLLAGAHWTWVAVDGEQVEIFLARFRNGLGAQSYYLMEHAAKLRTYATVTPEPVPGIATGFVLAIPTLDSYGNALVRLHAVAGDTVIVVNVLNPANPDPATADALALGIAKKLCSDQGCGLT